MVNVKEIGKVINILKKESKKYNVPSATHIGTTTKDPFKVLISCLISLRTKDEITNKVSKRLFEKASNVKEMLKLSEKEIAKLIYPCAFYNIKAKRIKEICKTLIKNYNGKVPDDVNELLKIKGIGRKTMGIVMCYGFGKTVSIPVDSHVHEVSNRLGWVKTKNPEKTEIELMRIIPRKYWQDFNDLFVTWGQNICVPVSPYCSKCAIYDYCKRVNVKYSR